MEKLYTVSNTKPGADCGSDHELLIAKFKLKLKKVGKTIRPFRYDLNQISWDLSLAKTHGAWLQDLMKLRLRCLIAKTQLEIQ